MLERPKSMRAWGSGGDWRAVRHVRGVAGARGGGRERGRGAAGKKRNGGEGINVAAAAARARQPPVAGAEDHVAGGEVPMDDAAVVEEGDGFADLRRDLGEL